MRLFHRKADAIELLRIKDWSIVQNQATIDSLVYRCALLGPDEYRADEDIFALSPDGKVFAQVKRFYSGDWMIRKI